MYCGKTNYKMLTSKNGTISHYLVSRIFGENKYFFSSSMNVNWMHRTNLRRSICWRAASLWIVDHWLKCKSNCCNQNTNLFLAQLHKPEKCTNENKIYTKQKITQTRKIFTSKNKIDKPDYKPFVAKIHKNTLQGFESWR